MFDLKEKKFPQQRLKRKKTPPANSQLVMPATADQRFSKHPMATWTNFGHGGTGSSASVVQRQSTGPHKAPDEIRSSHHAPFQVQRHAMGDAAPDEIHSAASQGIRTPWKPLPYLNEIQESFGRHDISGIRYHGGPAASQSARNMNASAYATGRHIVSDGPIDKHTAAHEAAHVVQQQTGVRLKDNADRPDDKHEQAADAAGDAFIRGESAESTLDQYAGKQAPWGNTGARPVQNSVVQRKVLKFEDSGAEYFDDPDPITEYTDVEEIISDLNWLAKGMGFRELSSEEEEIVDSYYTSQQLYTFRDLAAALYGNREGLTAGSYPVRSNNNPPDDDDLESISDSKQEEEEKITEESGINLAVSALDLDDDDDDGYVGNSAHLTPMQQDPKALKKQQKSNKRRAVFGQALNWAFSTKNNSSNSTKNNSSDKISNYEKVKGSGTALISILDIASSCWDTVTNTGKALEVTQNLMTAILSSVIAPLFSGGRIMKWFREFKLVNNRFEFLEKLKNQNSVKSDDVKQYISLGMKKLSSNMHRLSMRIIATVISTIMNAISLITGGATAVATGSVSLVSNLSKVSLYGYEASRALFLDHRGIRGKARKGAAEDLVVALKAGNPTAKVIVTSFLHQYLTFWQVRGLWKRKPSKYSIRNNSKNFDGFYHAWWESQSILGKFSKDRLNPNKITLEDTESFVEYLLDSTDFKTLEDSLIKILADRIRSNKV